VTRSLYSIERWTLIQLMNTFLVFTKRAIGSRFEFVRSTYIDGLIYPKICSISILFSMSRCRKWSFLSPPGIFQLTHCLQFVFVCLFSTGAYCWH
jgi:hypothetical protein